MTLPALKNFFSKNDIIDKNKGLNFEKYMDLINIKARSIEQEVGALLVVTSKGGFIQVDDY